MATSGTAPLDLGAIEELADYLLAPDMHNDETYPRFVKHSDMSALLAAARDCLELHQQLAIIHASKRCGSDLMTPLGIELWARELGWKPGDK
jgi:hypothetical protein